MEFDQVEESQSFDIKHWVYVFWRGKWWILIPAIMGLLVGLYFSRVLPEVYETSSLILVEEGSILNPLIGELAVSISPEQKLAMIRQEILSWPKLAKLIEILELDKDVRNEIEFEGLVNHLKRTIEVGLKTDNVIVVSYRGTDPYQVQDIVVNLTNIIIEKNLASHADDAEQAIDFISKQLDHYREKLEESEESLRKFKEIYTVQLPVITQLNDQLVRLQVQLNGLLIDNTEQHPSVISLRNRIRQIKGEIDNESQRLLNEEGIDLSEKKYIEIAKSIPRQQQEYQRLMRDQKVNDSLYQLLLKKYESAHISKKLDNASEATKFKVIETARLPRVPIAPDKPRIIIICFALGGILGAGIVFLKEFFNTSFKTIDDVKKAFDVPIIGKIAAIEDLNSSERKIAAKIQKRHKTRRKRKKAS